jgi:hypothetical protein
MFPTKASLINTDLILGHLEMQADLDFFSVLVAQVDATNEGRDE